MRNELGNRIWNGGGSPRRLDVFESPRLLFLCHDFERKDSIFRQADTPVEKSRPSDTEIHGLAPKVAGKGSLTIYIVQQGRIPVGAEGTRKGDVTEDTLVVLSQAS